MFCRLLQDTAMIRASKVMNLPLVWYGYGIREEWKVYEHKKLVHTRTSFVGFRKWVLHQHFKSAYSNSPSEIRNDCLQISDRHINDLLTRLETEGPTYEVATTASFQNSPFTCCLWSKKEHSINYGTLAYYLLRTIIQPISQ